MTTTEGSSSIGSTSSSLIERVKAHDQDAWRRLVRLYGPLVAYWIRRASTLQPADAADIFQTVFQAVARNIGRFRKDRAGDTFRGWLRTITRTKLADYHRQRSTEPQAFGGQAQERFEQIAGPVLDPNESGEAREVESLRLRALEMIRSEFEESTWQAFWRVTVEGHAPADVARDLGITASAVRLYRARILRRLREELRGLEP